MCRRIPTRRLVSHRHRRAHRGRGSVASRLPALLWMAQRVDIGGHRVELSISEGEPEWRHGEWMLFGVRDTLDDRAFDKAQATVAMDPLLVGETRRGRGAHTLRPVTGGAHAAARLAVEHAVAERDLRRRHDRGIDG